MGKGLALVIYSGTNDQYLQRRVQGYEGTQGGSDKGGIYSGKEDGHGGHGQTVLHRQGPHTTNRHQHLQDHQQGPHF